MTVKGTKSNRRFKDGALPHETEQNGPVPGLSSQSMFQSEHSPEDTRTEPVMLAG